jgi:hypothetical protein
MKAPFFVLYISSHINLLLAGCSLAEPVSSLIDNVKILNFLIKKPTTFYHIAFFNYIIDLVAFYALMFLIGVLVSPVFVIKYASLLV